MGFSLTIRDFRQELFDLSCGGAATSTMPFVPRNSASCTTLKNVWANTARMPLRQRPRDRDI